MSSFVILTSNQAYNTFTFFSTLQDNNIHTLIA
jgi:hypothetical protein